MGQRPDFSSALQCMFFSAPTVLSYLLFIYMYYLVVQSSRCLALIAHKGVYLLGKILNTQPRWLWGCHDGCLYFGVVVRTCMDVPSSDGGLLGPEYVP